MSEFGRVQLELLLLATVRANPSHGYAIIEAIRRTSDGEFDIPESAMYPAPYRLEHEGLVSSEWSEVGGRRRRIYRITPARAKGPGGAPGGMAADGSWCGRRAGRGLLSWPTRGMRPRSMSISPPSITT